jgi:hypothetical protein
MLESIHNQTRKPDLILLNIPEVFERTKETYAIPDEINKLVTINRIEKDFGPGTKIIPTVSYLKMHNFPPDTKIIYCDDDIYYLPRMVESYLSYHDDCVHGICGFNFINYKICGVRNNLESANIMEGYGAVCTRLSHFNDDFVEYIDDVIESANIRLSDDVYISNYFAKHGIDRKIHCVPGKYSVFDLWKSKCILNYGNELDALHLGANNTSENNVQRYYKVIHELHHKNKLYFSPCFQFGNVVHQHSLEIQYNIIKRINYYLNKNHSDKMTNLQVMNTNANITCDNIHCVNGNIIMAEMKKKQKHPTFSVYGKDMVSYLLEAKKTVGNDYISKPFMFRWGDSTELSKYSIISKARSIHDPYATILNLNNVRHWGAIKLIKSNDIPFSQKHNVAIWRGANAHIMERYGFVKTYCGSENTDIGFSSIDKTCFQIEDQYIKGYLSIPEQLQSKYLISIEGNDVSTGLKWQLYSNSVVLMKKPTKVSWAMEDTLIPYTHYVPLDENLSNLQEQLEWCEKNQKKCELIAKNSTSFIEQFLNPNVENIITSCVLFKYFE